MAKLVLVTGGARSGKSDYAQKKAEELPAPRCFVATSTPVDREMVERIKRHQKDRHPDQWQTIEEPIAIDMIFNEHSHFKTVLIDCITLWVSNVMMQASQNVYSCDELFMQKMTEKLMHEVQQFNGTVIIVTNEVGMGIVPENEIARRYRDLVGRCNRTVASFADEVILVSCGLPMRLK